MTRPVSQNVAAYQSLWHDFIHAKKGSFQGSFQMTAYYQKSIPLDETAQYFLFDFKNELLVLGDATHDRKFRDIRAEWLGLPSDFRGYMSICPEQTQIGVIMEYSQDLKKFAEYDFLKRFWVNISLPFIVVENSLNLSQWGVYESVAEPNHHPKDIIEAFNQRSWHYAKINGKMSRFNLAPIEIKLGGAFLADGSNQVVSYTKILIPTGQEDENHYLFEPLVGYNGHLGFGTGVNFQIGLLRDPTDYDICFFLNLEGVFLIRNWHYRTFDLNWPPCSYDCQACDQCCWNNELRGRPWSRYLLFNMKGGHPNQLEPGVNVLTRRVKVRPYNVVDFSMGWRVIADKFELEIGYNIWGHGSETIECIKRIERAWGIAGQPLPGDKEARSASMSTIEQRAENDAEFVTITDSDIDISSAESRGALNHRVHTAGGLVHRGKTIDAFFGAGAYYEIPQKNSALKTWGIWVKVGGSF